MSLPFLEFRRVSFTYASMTRPLLVDLQVRFPCGWTGVVGANGVGKSTLLKLAVRELQPQSGTVHHPGTSLYCAQRTDAPPEQLAEFLADTAATAFLLRRQLAVLDDWLERWDTLSHGERKRAQIGVALWREPDVLALDEPTNHIDADTRELLRQALQRFRGVGLLVSHDRDLLDELCDQCLFLDPPDATLRPGGVSAGAEQGRIERETNRRRDDQAKHAVNRLQSEVQRRREKADQVAARSKAAKNRKPPAQDHDGSAMRNLAKLTGKDAYAGKLIAQLGSRVRRAREERSGIKVRKEYDLGIWVEADSCSSRAHVCRLAAGDIPLGGHRRLHLPELVVRPTDRVAITGANGRGKSTLLAQLLKNLNVPAERLVYVPQEITSVESKRIAAGTTALPKDQLGRLMTIVSRLGSRPQRLLESDEPSPGEVRKILLATGIATGPYLIVMDEPTNHMDLPSIECLEDALADCPCALVLVSHDLHFLQALTEIRWHLAADGADSRLTVSRW